MKRTVSKHFTAINLIFSFMQIQRSITYLLYKIPNNQIIRFQPTILYVVNEMSMRDVRLVL